MSEKIRREFEEWFYEYSLPCEGDWFKRDSCGDYDYPSTHDAWMGWQASRAALVVELPTSLRHSECGYDYASEAFEETIDVVKLSLDSAGVNYK